MSDYILVTLTDIFGTETLLKAYVDQKPSPDQLAIIKAVLEGKYHRTEWKGRWIVDLPEDTPCPTCGGSGYELGEKIHECEDDEIHEAKLCSTCNGKGTV